MLKKLKIKLGFIYRGIIGIKDNIFDNPEINKKLFYRINIGIFNKRIFSIGKTVNLEKIDCYSFGNSGEKILYIGGLHGNETGTVKLMKKWVNFLANRLKFNLKKQVFIIPCLNLDGYKVAKKNPEYFSGGRAGKTNYNNVDLNRNFPAKNWSEKSTLFAAGKYFDVSGGNNPGSEPEIKVLLNFVEKENIKTIYMFHNCWGTAMSTFTESSDKKTFEYSKNSGYRIFSENEWDNLRNEQKTGHGTIWGIENNIDFIEIETKTRYGSEWKKNKKSLVNSLKI